MFPHLGHVMTLANSIIGVGILAMPFCFQKCGIVLSILLLIISNWITRISCHYLIKSSLLTRRKSFEILGFQAFGSSGKLLVELCIIGYLLGTCITYFVVVGDLGPQIITKIFSFTDGYLHLRTWIMIGVTLICILPLGMLKNVDSLSTVCTASIGFYICFVIKIILESGDHILANDWSDQVLYWQPSGILQCLPIFGMALSCQMQIFEVFGSINNQSVEKLNGIVRKATWICTFVYISVGYFGYVAFCTQTFSGNILVNFSPSFGSDVIKIGFVLSVACSFPLVIFPCRASIYSLLYRKGQLDGSTYIPEPRFKMITFVIVVFALTVALMIPSVELIIGLVGSTIGVAICIIFPAACFRKIVKKESNERALAQFIIVGGFCLMILGTYANLNAIDEKHSSSHVLASLDHPTIDTAGKDFVKYGELNVKIAEKTKKGDSNDILLNLPIDNQLSLKTAKQNNDELQPESKLVKMKRIKDNIIVPSPMPQSAEKRKKPTDQFDPLSNVEPQKIKDTKRNQTQSEIIDKEAIKKDDEVAAEEIKVAKNSEDELEKTKKELKETKRLLELKVDEIKEELAKQNEETQNLVVAKLGEVVEKVEEIERKVQQKEPETEKDNNIPKGTILKVLAKPAPNNNSNPKDTVYEPLSYKTGELLESSKNFNVNEIRQPLPLALLINASQPKVSERLLKERVESRKKAEETSQNELELIAANGTQNEMKSIKILSPSYLNNSIKEAQESKENVEAIRRDILQVKADKLPETTTTTAQPHPRVKRSNGIIPVDCEATPGPNVMLEPNIENLLSVGLKTYGTGRDLKAVEETDNITDLSEKSESKKNPQCI